MTDYTTIQQKIADLKSKATQNSISPEYLGLLLDELVALAKSIDTLLTETANGAVTTANSASETANNANATANSAAQQASSVGSQVSSLATRLTEQMQVHDKDIAALQSSVSSMNASVTNVENDVASLTESVAAKVDQGVYDARVAEVDEMIEALEKSKVDQSTFDEYVTEHDEVFSDIINSLSDSISNGLSAHEENVAIYPFMGFAPPTTSTAVSALEDGVWFSSSEGFFYQVRTGKYYAVPIRYNTTVDGEPKARTDVIFRNGAVLYMYDGSVLKEYVSLSVATELAELRSLVESLTSSSGE